MTNLKIEQYQQNFSTAVDEVWHNKNLRVRGTILQLGKTPEVFKALNVPNLPLIMKYSKLFEIKNKHNLTIEILKKIPNQINDPAMVFKNNKDVILNSFVILTNLVDKNNKSIIVALHTQQKQGKFEVNKLVSIYGRNINQIENALKHNELVYKHIQKSQLIMSRLQLPSSLLTDSQSIITNENIKVKLEKSKLQAFKKHKIKKSTGLSR